jgi:hypothetical protein
MGNECGAHTFPYIEVKNPTATVEHEASTSKIGEDQIFPKVNLTECRPFYGVPFNARGKYVSHLSTH